MIGMNNVSHGSMFKDMMCQCKRKSLMEIKRSHNVSDQAVAVSKLVSGPGLAGPNQWQSVAAWFNACLPALAVDN